MPQLFSALRVLSRHTVMKSALDFRVSKDIETDIGRFRVTFDLYNALNANSVLNRSQTYGTTGANWGNVTTFTPGRLIKIGGQYNWN